MESKSALIPYKYLLSLGTGLIKEWKKNREPKIVQKAKPPMVRESYLPLLRSTGRCFRSRKQSGMKWAATYMGRRIGG